MTMGLALMKQAGLTTNLGMVHQVAPMVTSGGSWPILNGVLAKPTQARKHDVHVRCLVVYAHRPHASLISSTRIWRGPMSARSLPLAQPVPSSTVVVATSAMLMEIA